MLQDLIAILQMFMPNVSIHEDMTLQDILAKNEYNQLDLIAACLAMQAMHRIDIPDDLIRHGDIPLKQLALEFEKLPRVDDPLWIARQFTLFGGAFAERVDKLLQFSLN